MRNQTSGCNDEVRWCSTSSAFNVLNVRFESDLLAISEWIKRFRRAKPGIADCRELMVLLRKAKLEFFSYSRMDSVESSTVARFSALASRVAERMDEESRFRDAVEFRKVKRTIEEQCKEICQEANASRQLERQHV